MGNSNNNATSQYDINFYHGADLSTSGGAHAHNGDHLHQDMTDHEEWRIRVVHLPSKAGPPGVGSQDIHICGIVKAEHSTTTNVTVLQDTNYTCRCVCKE